MTLTLLGTLSGKERAYLDMPNILSCHCRKYGLNELFIKFGKTHKDFSFRAYFHSQKYGEKSFIFVKPAVLTFKLLICFAHKKYVTKKLKITKIAPNAPFLDRFSDNKLIVVSLLFRGQKNGLSMHFQRTHPELIQRPLDDVLCKILSTICDY